MQRSVGAGLTPASTAVVSRVDGRSGVPHRSRCARAVADAGPSCATARCVCAVLVGAGRRAAADRRSGAAGRVGRDARLPGRSWAGGEGRHRLRRQPRHRRAVAPGAHRGVRRAQWHPGRDHGRHIDHGHAHGRIGGGGSRPARSARGHRAGDHRWRRAGPLAPQCLCRPASVVVGACGIAVARVCDRSRRASSGSHGVVVRGGGPRRRRHLPHHRRRPRRHRPVVGVARRARGVGRQSGRVAHRLHQRHGVRGVARRGAVGASRRGGGAAGHRPGAWWSWAAC